MKTTIRSLFALILFGSLAHAQTITKGVEYNPPQAAIPCHPNTSCMWIDTTNRQVHFFDGTTPKTVPSIVTSSKGDMALFNGTKWEKLASDGVNGHVLTVDMTTATGWKVAAASGGGTLAQTYNNGTVPADNVMTLDPTKGPVTVVDNATPLLGSLFRVATNDNLFGYIDVNPNVNATQFGDTGGGNFGVSLGISALFNTTLFVTLDNVFDLGGGTGQRFANGYIVNLNSGSSTMTLNGNGDQVNLSSTGLDPNVDKVTTLGTLAKRWSQIIARVGTIFFEQMLTSTNFGRGLLLKGTDLTISTPGAGVTEYSPLLEFQQSFGRTIDPESGAGSTRWAVQGRINFTTSYPDDRLAFLENPNVLGTPDYSASPEYVAISRYGVRAREFVSSSAAPTLTGGALGLLGVLSAVSVSGTNDAGIVSFTTGTIALVAASGNTAATAEILKLTFSDNFAGTNGCIVEWFPMGTDSNVGAQNTGTVFNNAVNSNSHWGVCSTTGSLGNVAGSCSLYWNAPVGSGGWSNTTAYKLGYKISCF